MRSASGKTVVVTGAAGGIGRAIALRFGDAGARVALLDRDAEPLASAAEALRARGAAGEAFACDVTRPDDCEGALRAVVARFGGVDVLVNNAGITHRSRFAETDVSIVRAVMEVNFFGSVHCTKAALPSLIERRGRVVVISSVAGFAPLVERAGYAASKHALHGFFDTLRAELAPSGVAVTLVCPSFTASGIDRHALGGAIGAAPRAWSTTGRLSTPEEVAEAVHRAVLRNRRLAFPTWLGRASWHLSRVAPALFERIMVRRLAASSS